MLQMLKHHSQTSKSDRCRVQLIAVKCQFKLLFMPCEGGGPSVIRHWRWVQLESNSNFLGGGGGSDCSQYPEAQLQSPPPPEWEVGLQRQMQNCSTMRYLCCSKISVRNTGWSLVVLTITSNSSFNSAIGFWKSTVEDSDFYLIFVTQHIWR